MQSWDILMQPIRSLHILKQPNAVLTHPEVAKYTLDTAWSSRIRSTLMHPEVAKFTLRDIHSVIFSLMLFCQPHILIFLIRQDFLITNFALIYHHVLVDL
jgi:hypothetical protein